MATAELRVCPFLGRESDRATRYLVPDSKHRCWTGARAKRVALDQQAALCLSDRYLVCQAFADGFARARGGDSATAAPASLRRPLVAYLHTLNTVLFGLIVVVLALIVVVLYMAQRPA